jgi:hypothetical protein
MKKIVVLFKKNIEKIYRVQIFLFILFILTSILFNLDSEAHKYYNNSIIDYNFHSVFAIFMLLLFGLFFWISIIYPFVWLIQLGLIYNYKASFSKKMWLVTISILLYTVTLICLLSLYFIERHQEFNERRNQEFIERSTIEKYKMNPSTNTSYPNKGYTVVMLVNTKMIKVDEVKFSKGGKNYIKEGKEPKKSGFFDTLEHWIVFEEVIGGTISWDEYDFKVFTWGEMKDIIVNPEIFSTNYYGYVYGK